MITVLLSVQHAVFNKDRDGSQDEGDEQVHVDEVPGAVQLPVEQQQKSQVSLLCSGKCIQKDFKAKKNNISDVKKSLLGSERVSLQLRLQEAESNQNHFEKGRPKTRPASK